MNGTTLICASAGPMPRKWCRRAAGESSTAPRGESLARPRRFTKRCTASSRRCFKGAVLHCLMRRRSAFRAPSGMTGSAAHAAAVIAGISATAAAVAGTPGAAAAAANQDDDDDEPQAGTVVVSVVKAHRMVTSLRDILCVRFPKGGLTVGNFFIDKNVESVSATAGAERNGGFDV